MVYFKVTDGAETRKFRVDPGELTFDQLKERIASLFPETLKDTSDLILKYWDAEGDLITLSSDKEFQEVLPELPVDHIWKMHISSCHGKKGQRKSHPHSLFNHFLEPSFGRRHHLWSDSNRQLRERQEFLDLLFGLVQDLSPSTSEDEGDPTPSTSEDKGNPTPSTSDPTPSTSEESEGNKEEDGVEVKSKKSDDTAKPSESVSPSCCPTYHYNIKTVRSWKPIGLFGPMGILGPVGYHITWSPRVCCNSTDAAASASA